MLWTRTFGVVDSEASCGPWGISSTAAVDLKRGVVYVISADGWLHALELRTGAEKRGWPISITAEDEDEQREYVWGGLRLLRNMLYVPVASYCDVGDGRERARERETRRRRRRPSHTGRCLRSGSGRGQPRRDLGMGRGIRRPRGEAALHGHRELVRVRRRLRLHRRRRGLRGQRRQADAGPARRRGRAAPRGTRIPAISTSVAHRSSSGRRAVRRSRPRTASSESCSCGIATRCEPGRSRTS